MKTKITALLLCIAVLILAVGCESNTANSQSQSSTDVSTILANGGKSEISQDSTAKTEEKSKIETSQNTSENEDVDIDLTILSDTMVYSEVYNIVVSPDTYKGKTIKIQGLFNSYGDDKTGKVYFYCLIADATACCTKGIEFKLSDDYSYPNDYPDEGSQITIVGTFDTYEYNDFQFSYLRDARIV